MLSAREWERPEGGERFSNRENPPSGEYYTNIMGRGKKINAFICISLSIYESYLKEFNKNMQYMFICISIYINTYMIYILM